METWKPNPEATDNFISRWQEGGGSERANYQLFLITQSNIQLASQFRRIPNCRSVRFRRSEELDIVTRQANLYSLISAS